MSAGPVHDRPATPLGPLCVPHDPLPKFWGSRPPTPKELTTLRTLILLRNFSFGLISFVNLSTTFFIHRFLTFFYFFQKNAFFNVFYSRDQRFDIYGKNHSGHFENND